MKLHSGRIILAILCIGVLLRLGWVCTRPTDAVYLKQLPDQTEYLAIAESLLSGSGFGFFDPGVNEMVYAYRMPGYPIFLAMCGANVMVVRIVQAVLDASLILGVYLLLPRTIRKTSIALIASLLVAVNPYLIYFTSTLLSETLFTVLMTWGMVLLIRSRWQVAGLGLILLIASVYVRPGAIGLPILLAIVAQLGRETSLGNSSRSFWRIPAGTLAILLLAVSLLPWAIRNRYHPQVNAWIFTTTNSGITLYDGLNEMADGSSNQAGFRTWPELQSMSEVERSKYFTAQAKSFVMENPRQTLHLALKKIARTWSPFPLSAEYGSNRMYVLVGAGFAIPFFLCTIYAVWNGPINRSLKLFLLLPALYFTCVHAITVGSLRYRVPADVPMAIVAASGVVGWWKRRTNSFSTSSASELDN